MNNHCLSVLLADMVLFPVFHSYKWCCWEWSYTCLLSRGIPQLYDMLNFNFLGCSQSTFFPECWSQLKPLLVVFSSVQFSRSVMSDSLRPHELQHARPPGPSPTPGVHSDSCPSSHWWHPAISSSVVQFSSCPQSLPASESFPMSQTKKTWVQVPIGVLARFTSWSTGSSPNVLIWVVQFHHDTNPGPRMPVTLTIPSISPYADSQEMKTLTG